MPHAVRDAELVAFIATTDAAASRDFYTDVLGLDHLADTGFSDVYDAHGTRLMVQRVHEKPAAPFTALGWRVDDIAAVIDDLTARGVELMRPDGLELQASGAWLAPGGTFVAWFTDPDGNVLSLQQDPA